MPDLKSAAQVRVGASQGNLENVQPPHVGIREVIVPKPYEPNVNEDLTPELRKGLKIHYMQFVGDGLKRRAHAGLAEPIGACAPEAGACQPRHLQVQSSRRERVASA